MHMTIHFDGGGFVIADHATDLRETLGEFSSPILAIILMDGDRRVTTFLPTTPKVAEILWAKIDGSSITIEEAKQQWTCPRQPAKGMACIDG